jgi:hypothetical protein
LVGVKVRQVFMPEHQDACSYCHCGIGDHAIDEPGLVPFFNMPVWHWPLAWG